MTQLYDNVFFDEIRSSAATSASEVAPLLLELTRARTVVDVGCGDGTWLNAFARAGVADYLGIDGSYVDRSTLAIPQDRFRSHDLLEPIQLDRRFDLAISLEVGEHLAADRAESFVHGLTSLADVVAFSAAIPGQGGTNHVNEQWPAYWSGLFSSHGYRACDAVRWRLWSDDRVAPWYRQNTIVYVRDSALSSHPRLAAEALPPGSAPPAVVHPELYVAKEASVQRLRAKLEDLGPVSKFVGRVERKVHGVWDGGHE